MRHLMRTASRLPRLRKTTRRVVSELPPGVGPQYSDTTQRGVVHVATRMQNGFKSQVRGGLDMRTILIATTIRLSLNNSPPSSARAGIASSTAPDPGRRSCVAFAATRAIARLRRVRI
jgi:hypothetical protein